ncbi:YjiH family protein [Natronincola ferrireducens]|uniref:Nucleoside recognition GATE domain-containing membrane protein YjiH n=1 Tax=Natronincola ferrireducens TaxID=393762 RepID=A0A1G8ZZG7_9FIRM|nr:YjiH family protein [Natronincola ferrireducens]SDK20498.1 nucleoside recognition GATE domain-containing membrane protein YjiH [Natronincola ferrireducens]
MIKTNEITKPNYSTADLLSFIVPSIIGVLIFMIPISHNGEITIPIAVFSGIILDILSDTLPAIITVLMSITVLGSIVVKTLRPTFITKHSFLITLFDISPLWLICRVLGLLFATLTLFEIGPIWVWSEDTGGLLLFDLLPILFATFLFAGIFLPLLLNFGLLEFFGTLLTRIMRPIFNLPGRSSIDCITSWLGDGTIGVLMTSKQYEEGYYTQREAAVIATTFSAVSVTFCLVVISQIGLSHLFIPFYLTVTLSGVVAAIIVPRIPPLSRKSHIYYNNTCQNNSEEILEGFTPFQWGLNQAIIKAKKNTDVMDFLKGGIKNVVDMWLGVLPIVMALGTLAVIIAEYTPVFQWLGLPFIPLLNLLQVPEAVEASQTLVVGFADMFLPAVIGSRIESELTRFIIACVSVTQLIYMSEVGGLLLGSKIPLSIKDLIIIFIQRTLVTLPIIVLIANIIF